MFYNKTLNYAYILQKDQTIHIWNFWWTKNSLTLKIFKNANFQNISQIIFPDKLRNLQKYPINIFYHEGYVVHLYNGKLYSEWNFYFNIVAAKLNSSINLIKLYPNHGSSEELEMEMTKHHESRIYDVLLIPIAEPQLFQEYDFQQRCFLAPVPPERSMYEVILFLPLDISCWMWLALTFAISALIWRIFEGPNSQWKILFGLFALFVGQYSEVKT